MNQRPSSSLLLPLALRLLQPLVAGLFAGQNLNLDVTHEQDLVVQRLPSLPRE